MEATAVYRLHIALRDLSPNVRRRVELPAGSSLADLQRVIQLSLGWSDEYQHRFCIRNHYLGASRPGGLLFFGDPETMMLSQFALPWRSPGPWSQRPTIPSSSRARAAPLNRKLKTHTFLRSQGGRRSCAGIAIAFRRW